MAWRPLYFPCRRDQTPVTAVTHTAQLSSAQDGSSGLYQSSELLPGGGAFNFPSPLKVSKVVHVTNTVIVVDDFHRGWVEACSNAGKVF
jgi:hypothetical protein